jgi:hypothetical protein
MLLSNFPTAAIPSVIGRWPFSALRGREQKVCRFLLFFKKQRVGFNYRDSQKNCVKPLKQSHAKAPSILAALLAKGFECRLYQRLNIFLLA